ncbi:MAG: putative substrate-binding transporter protein component [Acidimicrobiia bacterium]|nr:putative substrate-binding transporter protein component [Acidimicrobiia bacterium]
MYTRSKTAAVIVATGALLLSACGDDGKSATPTTTASTTATTAAVSGATTTGGVAATTTAAPAVSKAKFKVMVVTDFTSPTFSSPESVPAVKAALKDTPGAEVVSCDSKGDQNAALACGRKAVSDGVSVVISGYSAIAADFSALTAASIPILGALGNVTAPNAFALSGGAASYGALGLAAAKGGCKRAGILYLDGNPVDYLNLVRTGLEVGGSVEASRASVALNAPDMSAPVAKLLDAKSDCIIPIITPTQVIQALTAIKQSGANVKVAGFSAVFPKQVISSLGPLAEGVIISDSQLGADSKEPAIEKIRADITAVDSNAKTTTIGLQAWASGRVVAAAVKNADGAVDAKAMLAALNAVRDVDLNGIMHPFSAIEVKNASFNRFFNHYGLNYIVHNGVPEANGDFYDLLPILEKSK